MSVVREARYILANIENNNNKFWQAQLSDTSSVLCEWGRVGEVGDSLEKQFSTPDKAESFFESKCREKEKKGYKPLQTVSGTGTTQVQSVSGPNLEAVATQQITTSSPATLELVRYLTKANIHNILSSTTMTYDTSRGTFSTPLGIVDQNAIDSARALLSLIAPYVAASDYDHHELSQWINQYMMYVPQDIGRSKPSARTLYPSVDSIQRQNDILDALDASLQSVLSTNSNASQDQPAAPMPSLFEVALSDVTDGKLIDAIRDRYRATQQSIHGSSVLDVKRVYQVDLGAMNREFESDGARLDNIWDLWHGSKKGNLLSIMSKGFVIPPSNAAHCTGRMFGNGVYFSDQSTKALNYAWGHWDGRQDDNCFMFVAQVAMGKYYTPSSSMQDLPRAGYDSTFAEGGKSGVANNEMIVYRTSQIRPVFLVEFSRGGR